MDCTDEWSPDVTADEPTLAPGDEKTIRVEASNVVGLRFRNVPLHDDALNVAVGSASVWPVPDHTTDSYPPKSSSLYFFCRILYPISPS